MNEAQMLAKSLLAGCLTTLMLKKTIVLAKKRKPWTRWPRQIPLPQVLVFTESQANN
jgi:hypothetical protein